MTKVVSFDGVNINDGNPFRSVLAYAYGLPQQTAFVVAQGTERPAVSAVEITGRRLPTLFIAIDDSTADLATSRDTIHQIFHQKGTAAKRLVVQDDDGTRERFWEVVVETVDQVPGMGGLIFAITVVTHNDVFPRSDAEESDSFNATSNPASSVIANGGSAEAFPIFEITPNQAKTGGFSYKRFLLVRWRGERSATKYPVDVLNGYNTAALVSGGKMQADGDDLRIVINGAQIPRWLSGINTSSTKCWVNLDFNVYSDLTLATAISSGGSPEFIEVNEDITNYPDSGILVIGSEIFSYTAKSNSGKRFSGVTRATRGTSAAAHSIGATVWLCQHDMWMAYGNSGLSNPNYAITDRPAFSLSASNNGSWVYSDFGDSRYSHAGAWAKSALYRTTAATLSLYTANQGGNSNPWAEMGIKAREQSAGLWELRNACGISSVNFSNGEKRKEVDEGLMSWDAWVAFAILTFNGTYYPVDRSDISVPSSINTWQAWSQTINLSGSFGTGAPAVWMGLEAGIITTSAEVGFHYLEVADVTVTLDNNYTPTVSVQAELGNYSLDAVVANNDQERAIRIVADIALGDTVIVNTDDRTVILESTGESLFKGLSLVGEVRNWPTLNAGNNDIEYSESGLTDVDVVVKWSERYIY